jgi:hypothetical protein
MNRRRFFSLVGLIPLALVGLQTERDIRESTYPGWKRGFIDFEKAILEMQNLHLQTPSKKWVMITGVDAN